MRRVDESFKTGVSGRPLTSREEEIMTCMSEGLTGKQIGQRLYISEETVKKHIRNIYEKLGASNKVQALNCWQGKR